MKTESLWKKNHFASQEMSKWNIIERNRKSIQLENLQPFFAIYKYFSSLMRIMWIFIFHHHMVLLHTLKSDDKVCFLAHSSALEADNFRRLRVCDNFRVGLTHTPSDNFLWNTWENNLKEMNILMLHYFQSNIIFQCPFLDPPPHFFFLLLLYMRWWWTHSVSIFETNILPI